MYKSKRHIILINLVTFMLITTFLCQNMVWANEGLYRSCLAAKSRLTPFFEKHGVDIRNIGNIVMAISKLKSVIYKRAQGDVEREIEDLNDFLLDSKIKIEGTSEYIFKYSKRKVRYVVFNFKESGAVINALFIEEHQKLTVPELKELGINDEEKHHLDCPGLENVWLVKQKGQIPHITEVDDSRTPAAFCNLCNDDKYQLLYEMNLAGHDFKIVKCKKCGLVRLLDPLNHVNILRLYQDRYFTERRAGIGIGGYFSSHQRAMRMAVSGVKVNLLNKYKPEKGALFEIGAATGYFLEIARRAGWDISGIDVSQEAVTEAREQFGLDIKVSPIESFQFERKYDAFVMLDVMEHIYDVNGLLRKISEASNEGALIYIRTPDFGSPDALQGRANWSEFKLVHIYYFTVHTLAMLLDRHGFEIIFKYSDEEATDASGIVFPEDIKRSIAEYISRRGIRSYNTGHSQMQILARKRLSVSENSEKRGMGKQLGLSSPPKGTPVTLLRYMYTNKIFSDNPLKSIELARHRGGNDSLRTIQKELKVLKAVGLVEGSPKTGYYLPDWLRDVSIEDIIRENPELNLPNANNEQIKTIAERIMVDKDLKRIEQLITEVAANLNGRQTSANQRYGNNIETRKAEIIDLLRNYTIEVVINFLTVLKTYLNNEIPDASLFRGFDLILLNNLPASTERFHLWTTQAIEEFSTHLDAKIDKVRERTGKEPVVIEVAAGYADLSYGLKRLMASVRIIPTDGFHLQEGEDKDYDPKTIQSRGVRKLRVADVESGTFRKQLDIPEDTPVIIIASQLPLKGDVEKSLFNQAHVDELILITAYEPRSHKKGSGQEDIVANDKVWVVKSQSLNTRIWFSGVPSLEGHLELKLETFSRIANHPKDAPGAINRPSLAQADVGSFPLGNLATPSSRLDFLNGRLETGGRMEEGPTKTFGELLDSRKKPINYKFPLRKPSKVPTWQQLYEAKTVSSDDFLNLLSDYIRLGLPALSTLIVIYEKTSFTLEEAMEFLEILTRNTEAKHYVTAAENRKIKAYFEGRLTQDYPDLQKTVQESNLRETIERNKKDAELVKELLNNIVPATLKKDRTYEIRYDASRLSESQQEIINTYIKLLEERIANPDNIVVKPFRDVKRDYIIKVIYKDTNRQVVGEGQVNVNVDGELGTYPLQIIGMLNIALAAANVPDKLISDQVGEYKPLINFIQEQYKSITGNELAIPDSVEGILQVIRKIELPKLEKMDLDEVNKLNILAKELLTSA